MSEEIRIANHEEPGKPLKRKPLAAGRGRKPALPVKPGMDKVARKLTRQARTRLRRGNVPDTQVGRAASVNRMTIQLFRTGEPRNDMSLSMFLAVFNETGGDPAQAIANALADKETD